MKTYQDFVAVGERDANRTQFMLEAIREHQADPDVRLAQAAEEYDRQQNTTIRDYEKVLYTRAGVAIPDEFSPNHKIYSNFFNRFVTQENQYLLGNGLIMKDKTKKAKLGADFDLRLQELGRTALVQKVGFGFWNLDHLEVFRYTEFVPLLDEETGAIRAGIRFWQIDAQKPLRMTLFEENGFTEYIKNNDGDVKELKPKRAYMLAVKKGGLDDGAIQDGKNYPTLPIIPLWGNPLRQSELKGMRNSIDAYDLIKSGFANDLDSALVYWILQGTGGVSDVDFAKFLERIRSMAGGAIDDDVKIDAKTVDIPYESRVAYLERLEQDMYNDFQALNVTALQGGNKTATEINAAYLPLDLKCDQYEYCVLDFVMELFRLVGIDEIPSFKRNKLKNEREEVEMIMLAAEYLDDETILEKLPFLSVDEIEAIRKRKSAEDLTIIDPEE